VLCKGNLLSHAVSLSEPDITSQALRHSHIESDFKTDSQHDFGEFPLQMPLFHHLIFEQLDHHLLTNNSFNPYLSSLLTLQDGNALLNKL
jgi:hypothetical protein